MPLPRTDRRPSRASERRYAPRVAQCRSGMRMLIIVCDAQQRCDTSDAIRSSLPMREQRLLRLCAGTGAFPVAILHAAAANTVMNSFCSNGSCRAAPVRRKRLQQIAGSCAIPHSSNILVSGGQCSPPSSISSLTVLQGCQLQCSREQLHGVLALHGWLNHQEAHASVRGPASGRLCCGITCVLPTSPL